MRQSLSRLLVLAITLFMGCSSLELQQKNQGSFCERVPLVTKEIGSFLGESSSDIPECEAYSAVEFEQLLLLLLERDGTQEEVKAEEIVLKHIGLIPQSYDYSRCLKTGYLRQASAFYSPFLGKIILPEWSESNDGVLAHEVVHFYQDKFLSLSKLKKLRGFFHDSALAHGAVLEGDANRIAAEFMASQDSPERAEALPFKPLPLQDPSCTFPSSLVALFTAQYLLGNDFWDFVRSQTSWSREAVLKALPSHTRSILRPELYFREDQGPTLCERQEDPLGLYHYSLGELVVRTALKRHVKDSTALQAADGILDDCFSVAEKALRWRIEFEDRMDLEEFLNITHALQRKHLFPGEFTQKQRTVTYTWSH